MCLILTVLNVNTAYLIIHHVENILENNFRHRLFVFLSQLRLRNTKTALYLKLNKNITNSKQT